MLPTLKISAFLLKRLERIKQQCSGCLFGVFYGDRTLLLMAFNVESTIGKLNYDQIQHKFPAEIDLCGLVKFGDCSDGEAHISEVIKDVAITDNPIILNCQLGTLVGLRASVYVHGKFEEVPYEVMEATELYRDFCFTRIKFSVNIYAEQNTQSVRREMYLLRKRLSCGSLAFRIEPTKVYVTNLATHGSSSDQSALVINNESLILHIVRAAAEAYGVEDNKENVTKSKKKGNMGDFNLSQVFGVVGSNYDVININVLRCKTREHSLERNGNGILSNPLPAVGMSMVGGVRKTSIPLNIEAIAMLYKMTRVSRLYDILIESICRALRLYECSMLERFTDEPQKLRAPRIFHFLPEEFGHFLSCSYLEGISDDNSNMQEKRKLLHRHFGLPVTSPYFRRSNRCLFRNEFNEDDPLLNTHIGLRASGIVDGTEYLVDGNYYYYHYLQQNVQDNGWGCAYRSLQTICSWFLLHGYTERPVPTHREIQEYLVKIDDKQKNFIGSSQWIGSTEVSMCLQGFLQVDSKIMHITSGADMESIFTDLISHFQTHGTPIMIGGGVLAHTIIGISHSWQTGQVRFLILDPHYTGSDDLQTIQTKGWCGWKGVDFWDKKSYYNLCMPQRPLKF